MTKSLFSVQNHFRNHSSNLMSVLLNEKFMTLRYIGRCTFLKLDIYNFDHRKRKSHTNKTKISRNKFYVKVRTYKLLEIKPCGLGSRIRDVEAFRYKTEIKIIYFVPLCLILLIVSDCMVYPDPKIRWSLPFHIHLNVLRKSINQLLEFLIEFSLANWMQLQFNQMMNHSFFDPTSLKGHWCVPLPKCLQKREQF